MAKTRKKKSTAESVHIDINSHNASGKSKYKMLEQKPRHLKLEDIYDGSKFSYAGIVYDIVGLGDTYHVFNNEKHYGQIHNATKKGIYFKILFWNSTCRSFVSYKDLFFVA
jgi:hypothetical protein